MKLTFLITLSLKQILELPRPAASEAPRVLHQGLSRQLGDRDELVLKVCSPKC